MNTPTNSVVNIAAQPHPAKLVSLLALAGGAVALPQTGQADIIYTAAGVDVGFFGVASLPFTVPGTAQVGFFRVQRTTTTTSFDLPVRYRSVLAGQINSSGAPAGVGGNGPGFVEHLPFGASWDQPANVFFNAPIAIASDSGGQSPNTGYSNRYLAWVFNDSTQGNAPRYGWAEYSLSVAQYGLGGPTVTVHAYAYDNTGAKPTMGQVPEPSSAALLVLGAMALGSRGLRKWRQDRQPANQA